MLKMCVCPPALGFPFPSPSWRETEAQKPLVIERTCQSGPGIAATSLSPAGPQCLSCCLLTTPCPSQCPTSPERTLIPTLLPPVSWRDPVSLSPVAQHALSCCPLYLGRMLVAAQLSSMPWSTPVPWGTPYLVLSPVPLCAPCPVQLSHVPWRDVGAHPYTPHPLEHLSPVPRAPHAVPIPWDTHPFLPSAGRSPQLEVGRLGGVAEVNAHHHAGRVPGCQAL